MKGAIDNYGQPKIQLAISGMRTEIKTLVVIDTGFNGYICVPVELAIQLGLELYGREEIQLADGSIKNELIFKGSVMLGDEQRPVEIILTNSQQALLGTRLLEDKRLTIDFLSKVVEIE